MKTVHATVTIMHNEAFRRYDHLNTPIGIGVINNIDSLRDLFVLISAPYFIVAGVSEEQVGTISAYQQVIT